MALLSCSLVQGSEEAATSKFLLQETWNGTVLRIEDAKSRVSIAAVKLSVSDLKAEEGNLVGEYTIRVPIMSSSDDHGRIILPLDISMDELGENGGVLRGQAISDKEGKTPNLIVCEVIPGKDQKIRLDITTDKHTIKFKSNYSIVGMTKGS